MKRFFRRWAIRLLGTTWYRIAPGDRENVLVEISIGEDMFMFMSKKQTKMHSTLPPHWHPDLFPPIRRACQALEADEYVYVRQYELDGEPSWTTTYGGE